MQAYKDLHHTSWLQWPVLESTSMDQYGLHLQSITKWVSIILKLVSLQAECGLARITKGSLQAPSPLRPGTVHARLYQFSFHPIQPLLRLFTGYSIPVGSASFVKSSWKHSKIFRRFLSNQKLYCKHSQVLRKQSYQQRLHCCLATSGMNSTAEARLVLLFL